MIVIWLLGILNFTSDSGLLRSEPPKVRDRERVSFRMFENIQTEKRFFNYFVKSLLFVMLFITGNGYSSLE